MKKDHKPINRYSKWQYLTILIAIVLMFISALPNFYRGQTAIIISSQNQSAASLDAAQLKQFLNQNGITVKSIKSEGQVGRIVFQSEQDIPTAKQSLEKKLGKNYFVESVLEDDTPNWLKNFAAEPIKLGLDLSGGVLFVLEVDSEKAYVERMQQIKQTAKSLLRKERIRGTHLKLHLEDKMRSNVELTHSVGTELDKFTAEIANQFKGLTVSRESSTQIRLDYAEKERLSFHQEMMQQALTTMRGRISELGITEAVTQRQGYNRIRIELPGVKKPAEAKRIIGATASLDFYQLQSIGGKKFKTKDGRMLSVSPLPVFSGKNIKTAQAGRDEMGMPLVNLVLDNIGGEKMLRFSKNNIGKPMVTVFSEYFKSPNDETLKKSKVISVATIQSQLGARFSITNMASAKEAHDLALLLRAGSLSAPVTIVKQRTIGATLGESNIQNGMAALMLGVGLTLAFMAIWYRRLGLIANCALTLNLLCIVGLLSLLPGVVLTLPGIAGLVLTVGMAVDTNVIIFERIKEETKRGRHLPLAVERGYKNAFATIFDANITTMITALILYAIGYGPVKGFAVTLGLGIVTSLFTGVFISRALTNIFYLNSKSKPRTAGGLL